MANVKDLKQVISQEDIKSRVAELAAQISSDLKDQNPIFLGVLNGAFIFMSDLVRCLESQAELDFVRLASYGSSTHSSGSINMTKSCELDLAGRTVVVVEDIVDTGLTLGWLVDHLRAQGAGQVKTCAFIDKPERRESEVVLDYVGFTVPSGFLVGYGLDFDESYRCLPAVYELIME